MEDWRRLPRLHCNEALNPAAEVTLGAAPAHYLTHVLRLAAGGELRLFNARDGEWRAALAASRKHSVTLRVAERLREPQPLNDLLLCAAPIKKAHFDYMIEKATELGIGTLQPILTERTQIREVNASRAASIAMEAAEQSERLDLPTIHAPLKLTALIGAWRAERIPVICAEWGEAKPVAAAFAALPPDSKPAILTGPEGGFTPGEFDLLRQLPNATFIRLGPRILRADTAALAALGCWQALRGDWR